MIRPTITCAALALVIGLSALSGTARAATVIYSCQGGASFNATFNNTAGTLTLELQGGARIVLNEAVSGSGVRYTGGGYEFYGKAASGNLIRPGQSELNCREIGRINDPVPVQQPAPPQYQPPPPAQPQYRPPVRAASPSFNCRARLNATEARICANPALASLDRQMTSTYAWLRGQLPRAGRNELKRDQKNWLGRRNGCGSNDQCIQSQMYGRIAYLNEYLAPGQPPAPYTPPAQTGGVTYPFAAKSWGGIVRSGPGQNYRRVASLHERESITVLAQTGQYFQDRPWFKIRYRGRIGYHWGGIICPSYRAVPGTYQVCN